MGKKVQGMTYHNVESRLQRWKTVQEKESGIYNNHCNRLLSYTFYIQGKGSVAFHLPTPRVFL